MSECRQSNSSMLEIGRYLQKNDKIQRELQNVKYRVKFYELTQSHVFNFDVYKVFNERNQHAVAKFCSCFFRFLVLRMLSQYYDNYKCNSKGQSKPANQKNQKSISKVKIGKTPSIQEYPFANQPRDNKNRANTTTIFSKKDNMLPTQKRSTCKYDYRSQVQMSQKNKTQTIQQINRTSITEQQELSLKIIQTNKQIKQAYYLLNQTCGNKSRVAKIQIICFLIALISPDILLPIVQSIQQQFKPKYLLLKQKQKHKKSQQFVDQIAPQDKYDIEEQVYIVLTYQTLGNLVSPAVFTFLKRKYVKQTIFQSCPQQSYVRLVRSLKHIKDKLASQKDVVLIKGRRQRQIQMLKIRKNHSIQQQNQPFTRQKMKIFIKQSLKVRQTVDITKPLKNNLKEDELQMLSNKLRQSFYPSLSLDKIPVKLSLPKESPSLKHSISVKIKLNLQNIKQNKNKQIKRRKYVSNVHKTFYNLKPKNDKKVASFKNIRSERPSYKFNQLPLQDSNHSHTVGFDKQNIQHMKLRINKFKNEAKKDLQTIQQFKPSKIYQLNREKTKQNQQHSCQQQKNLLYFKKNSKKSVQVIELQKRNQNIKSQKSSNENEKMGKIPLRSKTDKQEVTWHQMYNIRTEPITTVKSIQPPKVEYKLSKNSDKLRKFQKQFVKECVKRVQALQDDIDLVERMRVL